MNAASAILIKLTFDTIVSLWADHAGKPPGWIPTAQDRKDLDNEVDNATPEERLRLAKLRAAAFPPKNAGGVTTAIEARD
jgi:hypothetical protein